MAASWSSLATRAEGHTAGLELASPGFQAPLEFGHERLELGDPLVLGPALLPPAVSDSLLELYRTLEDPPVLGLDPGALLYAPVYVAHNPPV